MPPHLVFVDTETTGLDPWNHEVYEISLLRVIDDMTMMEVESFVPESKDFWIEPTQLQKADSAALQIGRFYERRDLGHEVGSRVISEEQRWETAMEIARFTEGCYLVGAKPDFDAVFLTTFLQRNGACPAWHHRLIDIESLAVGILVSEGDDWGRPQSLSWICEELDVPRESHTARGDAEAAMQAYIKLMKKSEERDRLAALGEQNHG